MRQADVLKLPDGKHKAAPGIYLRVRDQGKHRQWIAIFNKNGKRQLFGLGTADRLTVLAAIAKGKKWLELMAQGIDPRETVEEGGTSHRFEQVAMEAIENRKSIRQWTNEKHGDQWVNTVQTYAVPLLGKKDIAEITRDDILAVLRPIWKTKSETATRLRSRLEVIFDYALRKGWREAENPARWRGGLEFDLAAPSKVLRRRHQVALSFKEAREVARALWESDKASELATLFGLLTGARCCEFVLADWREIDMKKKVWSVPAERRKDKKRCPHRVPLSRQAMAILERLGPGDPDQAVFRGRIAKHVCLETPKKVLRLKSGRNDVTMHGCRSTFRDWCADTGKDPILAEKSLMHATGNAVEQAYQRSDLLDRRRPLMQAWADALLDD